MQYGSKYYTEEVSHLKIIFSKALFVGLLMQKIASNRARAPEE